MAAEEIHDHVVVHSFALRGHRLCHRMEHWPWRLSQPRFHAKACGSHGAAYLPGDFNHRLCIARGKSRPGFRHRKGPGRRNRLAWVPGSGAFKDDELHRNRPDQWDRWVVLALSPSSSGATTTRARRGGLACHASRSWSIGLSFIFAWMRLKSGSLWTAAMLHASHNLYVQEIFTPLTRNTGKTAWFIDEFGAVLPLVVLFFAIYFWRRRGELNLRPYRNQPVS